MPLDLSGIRVERHRGGGIEVGQLAVIPSAGAPDRRIPGAWIAGSEHDQIGFGIVRADEPGRGPAMLPGVALPAVTARFARSWHRVGLPKFLAGVHVVGLQAATRAILAAAKTCNDLVLHNKRR